jgi:hypothetical protein
MPANQMNLTDQAQPTNMVFPVRGIDNSAGYDSQAPGTTLIGNNVRAYDAVSLRQRGGSRQGLTPFLGKGSTQQVAGTFLVQHLGCVVWVTASAVG